MQKLVLPTLFVAALLAACHPSPPKEVPPEKQVSVDTLIKREVLLRRTRGYSDEILQVRFTKDGPAFTGFCGSPGMSGCSRYPSIRMLPRDKDFSAVIYYQEVPKGIHHGAGLVIHRFDLLSVFESSSLSKDR